VGELFEPTKTRSRAAKFGAGDVFLVKQSDGLVTVGQVMDCPMSCATVALFAPRINDPQSVSLYRLDTKHIISAVTCTPELLKSKVWPVVDRRPVVLEQRRWPSESTRAQKWVGMEIQGAGIVRLFLEAYYGLALWDDWHDPKYLDGLLFESVPRPASVRMKNRG
jgi:hypothetical protein